MHEASLQDRALSVDGAPFKIHASGAGSVWLTLALHPGLPESNVQLRDKGATMDMNPSLANFASNPHGTAVRGQ